MLASLVAAVVSTAAVLPQTPAQATKASPPDSFPRTLEAESLPPGFKGDPLRDVHSARTPAPKGEFETTEQYQRRLAAPGPDQLYFFVEPITPEYNADTQEYVISLYQSTGVWIGRSVSKSDQGFAKLMNVDIKGSRKYTATNSFGASITVTRLEQEYFYLLFPRQVEGNGTTDDIVKAKALRLPVPIAEAPALKKDLGLVWICRLGGGALPATVSGVEEKKPTLQSPWDTETTYRYLRVEPVALWAFDKKTGRILKKLDAYPQ